jgi:hypothetical protein
MSPCQFPCFDVPAPAPIKPNDIPKLTLVC